MLRKKMITHQPLVFESSIMSWGVASKKIQQMSFFFYVELEIPSKQTTISKRLLLGLNSQPADPLHYRPDSERETQKIIQ